ncbi:MAG TPA: VWA domain-containing protein [Anaerolineae bacterium]|nr:VWA domain-containing protein [Anaerolineae bacterium]HQH39875.1 VWA domain-containing protein [Anaerolineae bacterium]
MSKRPGGQLATRPLHFIWIADASGSMKDDGKIQALNMAIREAIPHMQKVAAENPNAQVLVRAIKFSSGAQWHISQPTPVEDFKWVDLKADGVTDMGKALSMVADQLKIPPMTDRALPPVLVLISDGQPTDSFEKGLQKLMDEPWGKKAVRIAIAIGQDADHSVLQKFIGHSEIKPLQANNPEALVNYIKWVSTAVLKSASSPASQAAVAAPTGAVTPAGVATPPPIPTAAPSTPATPVDQTPPAQPVTPTNIPIPAVPPPVDDANITADDVW